MAPAWPLCWPCLHPVPPPDGAAELRGGQAVPHEGADAAGGPWCGARHTAGGHRGAIDGPLGQVSSPPGARRILAGQPGRRRRAARPGGPRRSTGNQAGRRAAVANEPAGRGRGPAAAARCAGKLLAGGRRLRGAGGLGRAHSQAGGAATARQSSGCCACYRGALPSGEAARWRTRSAGWRGTGCCYACAFVGLQAARILK
mmetsp:Transcript_24844/g.62604  ORF Transcript_24844/g.62604 Transcript_24844/m.62604 type:complete len:201 (-) Transcript_24844:666-1268(-)